MVVALSETRQFIPVVVENRADRCHDQLSPCGEAMRENLMKACKVWSRAWVYPLSEDVLEAAGLYTVRQYIEVRRQTITAFIMNWPIFDLCQRGVRKRGSSPHQFWWEQTFDLEEARASAAADATVVSDDDEEAELANP